jgi:hypothetical protein
LSNKHEDEFWEQMKEVEKKKANLLKKELNKPQPEKKKKNSAVIWGISLGVSIVLFGAISLLPNQSIVPAIKEIQELSNKEIKEEVIHDYLVQTQGLGVEIGQQLNKLSDTTKTEGLTVEQIKKLKTELGELEAKAHTGVAYLKPVQDYYISQSSIVEKVMDEMVEVKEGKGFFNTFQIRELKKDYDKNALQEQEVIVTLFEKSGIYYEIKEDGSLYYEIGANETK